MSEQDQGRDVELSGEHPERPLLDLLGGAVERCDWDQEEDVLEITRLLTRIGHNLPRDQIEEWVREFDRAEAVGPLLNPGDWDATHFDTSEVAKRRLRAVLTFMDELEDAEEFWERRQG